MSSVKLDDSRQTCIETSITLKDDFNKITPLFIMRISLALMLPSHNVYA